MSIPNIITFARLLAVPVIIYWILRQQLDLAFWGFVAAGVSDALDGAIARTCQMRTKLGGYLDPIADKVLLVGVYVSLVHIDVLPLWLVMLVVTRDLMIVGGFLLASYLREPLAVQPLAISKINTAAQITLVAMALAPSALGMDPPSVFDTPMPDWMIWIAAATTTASGAAYVWRGWLVFESHGRAG